MYSIALAYVLKTGLRLTFSTDEVLVFALLELFLVLFPDTAIIGRSCYHKLGSKSTFTGVDIGRNTVIIALFSCKPFYWSDLHF